MLIKISKLIPEEIILCHIAGGRVKELSNRYTGKTFGVAFSLIGEAMVNPCKLAAKSKKTIGEATALREVIEQIINTTNLQFLEVGQKTNLVTITYIPFYTRPEYAALKDKAKEK